MTVNTAVISATNFNRKVKKNHWVSKALVALSYPKTDSDRLAENSNIGQHDVYAVVVNGSKG